jgi:hypothetical protein
MPIIHRDNDSDIELCRAEGEFNAFTSRPAPPIPGRNGLLTSPCDRCLVSTFVDSDGLAARMGGIRRKRKLGGRVAVACSGPMLARMLHTTGLHRIVTVTSTVNEASRALQRHLDRSHRPPVESAVPEPRRGKHQMSRRSPRFLSSEPRGPHQGCPACGSLRWVQHAALFHQRERYWSAKRSCKACGHAWDAWTEP